MKMTKYQSLGIMLTCCGRLFIGIDIVPSVYASQMSQKVVYLKEWREHKPEAWYFHIFSSSLTIIHKY
jgi:hypothetical protein